MPQFFSCVNKCLQAVTFNFHKKLSFLIYFSSNCCFSLLSDNILLKNSINSKLNTQLEFVPACFLIMWPP